MNKRVKQYDNLAAKMRVLVEDADRDVEMYTTCNARQAETITKLRKLLSEASGFLKFLFEQHAPYMARLKSLQDEGVLKRLAEHAECLGCAYTPLYRQLGEDLKRLVEAVGAKADGSK